LDEDAERAGEGGAEFESEGPVVFAFETVFVGSGLFVFEMGFALGEYHGRVGLDEEEVGGEGAEGADYG
jgi:hypothetical protein